MHPRLPRRIAVFCLPGIGDTILYTPALARLRRAFPDARITALTMFDGAADILRTNPDLDEVRRFDFVNAGLWSGIRYVWGLRRERFELAILGFPANRLEYNLVNALVGRRWRAGHRYRRQRWRNLSFLNNVAVPETGGRHNVEENLALVDAICRRLGVEVPAVETPLRLQLTSDNCTRGDAFLAGHGLGPDDFLIGIHPYSSTFKSMHRKCWDKDHFASLVSRVSEIHPRARVLVFSGPSDAAVNDYIVRRAGGHAIIVEERDLRTALGVMRHCRLFISNDSGIMHLAGALGVPVVALFGPTDWRRLHPWRAPHVIVREDLPCMPCFHYSTRPLRCVMNIDYACMRDIPVDGVIEAARALLGERGATAAAAEA